ncbi:MAG: hypothetical protein ACOYMS_05955 [Terrimicrobiaceae bacterium]
MILFASRYCIGPIVAQYWLGNGRPTRSFGCKKQMQASIEDFKTGWYGITLGLKKSEIDALIAGLIKLRDEELDHLHGRSDFKDSGGVGDIEFSMIPEDSKDNLVLAL